MLFVLSLTLALSAAQAQPQARTQVVPPPPAPIEMPLANLPPGLEGQDILLAVKTGQLIAIRSYRIEGDQFHYRSFSGGHNTIAVSLIDMERSRRLNGDRKIQFPEGGGTQ